jgi:hypothetical protein
MPQAPIGMHDLGRVLASPTEHAQRMPLIRGYLDYSAILDAHADPAAGRADSTDP